MEPEQQKQVSFLVPRHLVKQIKTALEASGKSHATAKIRPVAESDAAFAGQSGFLVPTAFLRGVETSDDDDEACRFLREHDCADVVTIVTTSVAQISGPSSNSAFETAVRDWYGKVVVKQKKEEVVSDPTSAPFPRHVETLVRDLPKTYSIYGPLLLLPQHAFQTESWSRLLNSLTLEETDWLFQAVCECLNVSHVATNAPIPLLNSSSDDGDKTVKDESNILRSPTNLHPLHGDFGSICIKDRPTVQDFEEAFWASTKQNGITQFWAPRYTMFSRGNITEKARVLNMPSVKAAITQASEAGCSAVDLYAGIGYFTFSYAAAGVRKVLCWDLNPWSIEGLRRGALKNKWAVQVFYGERTPPDGEGVEVHANTRLVAFVESNEKALARIQAMRDSLPPIRHVNLGLLPTSRGSYATAAAALDPRLGGWVHVHENFGVHEITSKAQEVMREFEKLIQNLDMKRGFVTEAKGTARTPAVEHIQRVKSYAPGVFHCVVDVFVPPIPTRDL